MKQATEINTAWLDEVFQYMEEEAAVTLHKEGFAADQIVMERKLDLRYLGQSYELTIPLPENFEAADLFHSRHQEIYGYAATNEPIEVVNARLTASGLTKKPEFQKAQLKPSTPSSEALLNKRKAYFQETDWIETPIYSRDALLSGNRLEGPAIIEQYDATTVIPPRWHAFVDEFSNLHLNRRTGSINQTPTM